MTDKLLDVPYYRQIDPTSPLEPAWQEKGCGILALKMVIDFHFAKIGKDPSDLMALLQLGIKNGGTLEGVGWYHSTLVSTAISYGFLSWRRNWRPAKRDKDFFRSEGVDDESLKLWESQTMRESLPTLVEEVENGFPVIIAVAKNFDEVDKGHFVVLTGIKRRDQLGKYQGFYYNDPYSPNKTDRKDRYVPIARFTEKWKYQAIFIRPQI